MSLYKIGIIQPYSETGIKFQHLSGTSFSSVDGTAAMITLYDQLLATAELSGNIVTLEFDDDNFPVIIVTSVHAVTIESDDDDNRVEISLTKSHYDC